MAKINVSKWQAARRGPAYTPVMQFFLRMIRMALFEAMRVQDVPCPYGLLLTERGVDDFPVHHGRAWDTWDAAVMARDWIARAAPDPHMDRDGYLLSFDAACQALGLTADYERVWMLEKIDSAADFDTDEVWKRIEYLTLNPPDESIEPLFDAPRCVPALDQGNLFAMMEAA